MLSPVKHDITPDRAEVWWNKTERDIGEQSHGNNTLSGTDGETVHYITLELSGSGWCH